MIQGNPDRIIQAAVNDLIDFMDRTFKLSSNATYAHELREKIREYLIQHYPQLNEHWLDFIGAAIKAVREEEKLHTELVIEQVTAREEQCRQQNQRLDIEF